MEYRKYKLTFKKNKIKRVRAHVIKNKKEVNDVFCTFNDII